MSQASYTIPSTIDEALVTARECANNYVYFGGGTDIQVYRKQGILKQQHIIDLTEISELKGIYQKGTELDIGSMVTLEELISSAEVVRHFPLIAKAAKAVATPVIRKTATVGGNLLVKNRCTFYNQSKEWRSAAGSCLRETGDICQVTGTDSKCYSRNVSDIAPALIALNARIVIKDQNKADAISLIDLYAPDGINTIRNLDDHGIITRILVSLRVTSWWYRKLRLRRSADFSSLTVAATVDDNHVVRLCLNGISMAPVLVQGGLLNLTLDEMKRQVRQGCKIVDNDMLPLSYRREMIGVFLEDCWNSIGAN